MEIVEKITATVIGSVPGSSSCLAELMKREEKMNELVGKRKFLLETFLLNLFFSMVFSESWWEW